MRAGLVMFLEGSSIWVEVEGGISWVEVEGGISGDVSSFGEALFSVSRGLVSGGFFWEGLVSVTFVVEETKGESEDGVVLEVTSVGVTAGGGNSSDNTSILGAGLLLETFRYFARMVRLE